MEKSHKEDLTSAKDITIELLERRESAYSKFRWKSKTKMSYVIFIRDNRSDTNNFIDRSHLSVEFKLSRTIPSIQ